MDRLETIVNDMEHAELPLEDVLKKYEEGAALVRFCSTKLDEAEKKIEILTKNPDGSIKLQPFTEPNPPPAPSRANANAIDDDGKLF